MYFSLVLIFCLSSGVATAQKKNVTYDKFTGKPVTTDSLAYFQKKGLVNVCTMTVKPCNKTEGRRSDASCNNLKYPSMGTFLVPQERLLKAEYNNGSSRLSYCGNDPLPEPRAVRVAVLYEGKSVSNVFTQAIPGFGIWSFGDVGSIHDITYFLINKTDCCQPGHMKDYMCTPNIVRDDDPTLRFTNIRCMNLTRPLDHQFLGCTNNTTPSPIARATSVMDLSQVYNAANDGEKVIRSYEGGELLTEKDEHGVVWPPQGGEGTRVCMGNRAPDEKRCYTRYPSTLLSGTLLALWLVRNHNHNARELAKVNPNWSDDKLYYTAREMNIATYLHILYDEWLVTLTGEEYLQTEGCTSADGTRKDRYNSKQPPQATLEFIYVMRYFHTVQEPMAYKYDENGTLLGGFSQTQLMFRPGFLAKEQNIAPYSRGFCRQPSAAADRGLDPDIGSSGIPLFLQNYTDLITSDIHKARTLGIAPYVKYIKLLFGDDIESWEDLEKYMSHENIELLKTVYKCPEDIDLLVGCYLENIMEGGNIPRTVAALIVDHLKKNIVRDRFWYERPNRPSAFTEAQLAEIKKTSLAYLICTNGDGISNIQQKAFQVISTANPEVNCEEIEGINFSVFADSS